ncbi:MAG: hypothetical protein QGF12_02065 [SAR202 cluster bacterium]|nr:hypothetical protein [SAR202 cluster bacterium]
MNQIKPNWMSPGSQLGTDMSHKSVLQNKYLVTDYRKYIFLLLVLVFATVSCQKETADESVSVAFEQTIPEIRYVVTASVLITDDPVNVPKIDRIMILPQSLVLDGGEAQQMTAQAFSKDNALINNVEFTWSITDPRAGVISKDGWLVASNRPGTFLNTVSATAIINTPQGVRPFTGHVSLTVISDLDLPKLQTVTIIPPNPTLMPEQIYRMRAVGFDENGEIIPDVNFVWQLHVPELGRINDIGYLTILNKTPGTYLNAVSVKGIWEGQHLTAITDISIIDTPKADDFVKVHALPQRLHLDPGDNLQLRAVALNGLGELVTGTQLRWTMMTPKAGMINGSGLFVAGQDYGIYTEAIKVEALVPSESGFVRAEDYATLVIRQEKESYPLARLSVKPRHIMLQPRGRSTLSTRALNESGDIAENVYILYNTDDDNVGSIDQLGAFVAGHTPGVYKDVVQVTATQESDGKVIAKTSNIDVVITGQLTSAAVNPTAAVIAPGKMVHFKIVGRDENGVGLPGLVVIWSVEDESIGTIDGFGNFLSGTKPGLYESAIKAEVIQKLPYLLETSQ